MTISAPPLSGRAGPNPGLATFALPDGVVVAVRDEPADRPSGNTVVLVHGWTQDHTSWDDVVAELRRTRPDLRVIAYDGRGHGWSDAGPRSTATIDRFADDLAAVVEGLVPDGDVVLAGHSLGGPVIMAFAERHPHLVRERVAGVAFVATSAAGLGKDIFGFPGRLTAPVLLATPLVTRVRGWSRAKINTSHPGVVAFAVRLGLYGPGNATPRNRRRTAAQVARSHPATTAALVDEMIRNDRRAALDTLAGTPVAVLAGTKDGLCPMAHSRAIASAVPHGEFVVFPGAGHMLPYERPAEVAEQIAALARTPARSG